jgi:hypothetical protein
MVQCVQVSVNAQINCWTTDGPFPILSLHILLLGLYLRVVFWVVTLLDTTQKTILFTVTAFYQKVEVEM